MTTESDPDASAFLIVTRLLSGPAPFVSMFSIPAGALPTEASAPSSLQNLSAFSPTSELFFALRDRLACPGFMTYSTVPFASYLRLLLACLFIAVAHSAWINLHGSSQVCTVDSWQSIWRDEPADQPWLDLHRLCLGRTVWAHRRSPATPQRTPISIQAQGVPTANTVDPANTVLWLDANASQLIAQGSSKTSCYSPKSRRWLITARRLRPESYKVRIAEGVGATAKSSAECLMLQFQTSVRSTRRCR